MYSNDIVPIKLPLHPHPENKPYLHPVSVCLHLDIIHVICWTIFITACKIPFSHLESSFFFSCLYTQHSNIFIFESACHVSFLSTSLHPPFLMLQHHQNYNDRESCATFECHDNRAGRQHFHLLLLLGANVLAFLSKKGQCLHKLSWRRTDFLQNISLFPHWTHG